MTKALKGLNSNRLMSYMSMERQFKYLTNKRVVWRRDPTTDIPDEETKEYLFYKMVLTKLITYLEVKLK